MKLPASVFQIGFPFLVPIIVAYIRADQPQFEMALQKAEYLFNYCYQDSAYTDSAYQLLAAARPEYPDNESGLAIWAQVNIEMGDIAKRTAEKIAYYTIAQFTAETLKLINPESPAGHFWWAVAYDSAGLAEGTLIVFFRVQTIRRKLDLTLELDSNFVFAYAILGIFYRELPAYLGVPLLNRIIPSKLAWVEIRLSLCCASN
jgi:hypothetical protein